MEGFPKKTKCFLQIASSQTERRNEIRGGIRAATGVGQSPHGTTELSYAGGDETTALRKSREGWGTVHSPPGKASIITKYSPGVLPPSFGRTAEQHHQLC